MQKFTKEWVEIVTMHLWCCKRISKTLSLDLCSYSKYAQRSFLKTHAKLSHISLPNIYHKHHTGQCKRNGGCYNELVVAFFSTGGGVKGKKIYICWLYYLFINLHLFYLWWHLAHRPPVTLQFMALPNHWWFNSWFGLQIQHSSGVLPWQVLFSSVTA